MLFMPGRLPSPTLYVEDSLSETVRAARTVFPPPPPLPLIRLLHVVPACQALTLEADRVFKRTVKEDHDFNEFQQQREKVRWKYCVLLFYEYKRLETHGWQSTEFCFLLGHELSLRPATSTPRRRHDTLTFLVMD